MSPPKSKKRSISHGTPSIKTFYSPSPNKKKKQRRVIDIESENKVNGAAVRTSGSSQNSTGSNKPFGAVDLAATSASSVPVVSAESGATWGLLRVDQAELLHPPATLVVAHDSGAQELVTGCVMGRNVSNKPLPRGGSHKKIDLNISSSAVGVSRKHLMVTQTSSSASLKLKQLPTVHNQAAVYRYNAVKNTVENVPILLGKGQENEFRPGDVICFDFYDGSNPDVRHLFRVVRIQAAAAAASPQQTIDLCTSSDSSKSALDHKAKQPTISLVDSPSNSDNDWKLPTKKPPGAPAVESKPATECAQALSSKPATSSPKVETNPMPKVPVAKPNLSLQEAALVDAPTTNPKPKAKEQAAETKAQATRSAAFSMDKTLVSTTEKISQAESKAQAKKDKTSEQAARPSPKPSDSPSVSMPPPQVGSLFRVQYEMNDDCARRVIPTWWIGTARSVSSVSKAGTYKVKLSFDTASMVDKEDELDYPGIQLVEKEGDLTYVMVPSDAGDGSFKRGDVVCDDNPKELIVGDMVETLFQNGAQGENWYRGRVSKIDKKANTCHIAYLDGDYEGNVPIGQGKIHLVDRDNSWLVGQDVSLPEKKVKKSKGSSKKNPKLRQGTITEVETKKRGCTLHITFADGKAETRSYADVAGALFDEILNSKLKDGTALAWPARDPKKPKKKKATAKTKMTKSSTTADKETVLEELKEPEYERQLLLWDEDKDPNALTDMSTSLASTFWRALNSTEPHMGLEFLSLMATFHKQGPNKALGMNLMDLCTLGPENESVRFPDPNRLEQALQYVDLMVSNPCRMESLSSAVSSAISSWPELEEVFRRIEDRVFCVALDAKSTKPAAVKRVSQSLQVSCAGAQLIVELLRYQLGDFAESCNVDKDEIRAAPLVQALRSNPRGLRDSLKFVIQTSVKCFVQNSHFLSRDLESFSKTSKSTKNVSGKDCPSVAVLCTCNHYSKKLNDLIGEIVSFVAWVYCTDEDVAMKSKDVAIMFRNAVTSEIDNTEYDPLPFLKNKKKIPADYWKIVKLDLVLALDENFSGPLRKNLAKMLNVEKELTFLTEF